MDREAASNRSLWDVTQLAGTAYETVGDNARGRSVRVPFKDSVQGYQLVGNQLRAMDLSAPENHDFMGYATNWEQRYSALIPERRARLTLAPVVSSQSFYSVKLPPQFGGGNLSMFPIVGHYGTVLVQDVIVLKKFATKADSIERTKAFDRLLDQGVEAYVEESYPGGGWGSFAEVNNIGPNRFAVLTDPEGRILARLGASGSEPGLESEDPISFLMAGISLLSLASKGGRLVFRLISRRAAAKAAQKAGSAVAELLIAGNGKQVAKLVGQISIEEMEQHLGHLISRAELRTLANARGLTGEALQRETLKALHQWETTYGRTVQYLERDALVGITGDPNNLMTLRGDRLLVQRELLAQPQQFFQETIHELSADALGVRGVMTAKDLPFIGAEFTRMNNGLFILENAIRDPRGLQGVLDFFREI